MRQLISKTCIAIICIVLLVPIIPMKAYAGSSGSMTIYAIYMQRANGNENDQDRYGDAVLIKSAGKYLLMDTGACRPVKNSNTVYKSTLVNTLKSIGVKKLDVYISHVHGDHTGGLEYVCKNFKVGKLYLPDTHIADKYYTPNTYKPIKKIYKELAKTGKKYGAKVVYLSPSFRKKQRKDAISSFKVGDAKCKVMGPIGGYTIKQFKPQDGIVGTKEGHYLNNYSLTTRITCGGVKFLSKGDIEAQEELKLAKRYGSRLNADIVKTSHHGLRTSTSEPIVIKETPRWSFAQDHGFTKSTSAAKKLLKKYGFYYGVATNRAGLIITVKNGTIKMYKDANNNGIIDEPPYTGWVAVGDKYQYYGTDGAARSKWQNINGANYYLCSANGFRFTGTHTIKKNKFSFKSDGKLYDPTNPAKVDIYKIRALTQKRVKFLWYKVSTATRYQVYRSTSADGSFTKVGTVPKDQLYYLDRNLTKGKTYYYKVRAVMSVSGLTLYGDFSEVKSAVAK